MSVKPSRPIYVTPFRLVTKDGPHRNAVVAQASHVAELLSGVAIIRCWWAIVDGDGKMFTHRGTHRR